MRSVSSLLLLVVLLIIICFSDTNAQKTTNPVIYVTGVPATCVNGRIYVNVSTGNIYTFKTAVGCILAGNVGATTVVVSDTAYDATTWNGNLDAASKNAIRDKFESLGGSSYLVYTALLNQTGTSVPVATILQNTLGGVPVYTRTGVGKYTITLSGVFTVGKTFTLAQSIYPTVDNLSYIYEPLANVSANSIDLTTKRLDAASGQHIVLDGLLINTPIEIRVYP